jgi:hypothetical protein
MTPVPLNHSGARWVAAVDDDTALLAHPCMAPRPLGSTLLL